MKINIIPQPRQVSYAKSPPCVLDSEWTVLVESTADETTRLAAELITKDLNAIWGLKVSFSIDDNALVAAGKSIILGVPQRDKKIDSIAARKAIALNPTSHPQGYKIFVMPGNPILLLANTSQGLFYAAQTIRQMITRDTANQIILTPVVIDDWPLFDFRGVQMNINEGIKMDYLKNLIHLLAYYKMNILALQTSSLTIEQITELTKEASAYQINLVGNISMINPNSSHHICADKERCGHLGGKPLGWADLMLKEQKFYSRIPKTTIVANTFEQDNTYNISNYYEQMESFRREGLEQILCPRISFQDDLFSDIKTTRRNIYNTSQAGLRHLDNSHNIMGIMLCQNPEDRSSLFETCLEPIAFTAECAWLPDRTDADRFSANLNHSLFGISGTEAIEIINLLSSCNELISNNVVSEYILADPFKNEIHLDAPHFYGSLRKIKSISEETHKKIASLYENSRRSKEILDTWRYATGQWQAFAGRFLSVRDISIKYRQEFYDWRYNFESAPAKLNYQSIKKEYEKLLDKSSEELDALEEEYKMLISQRYNIAEAKSVESFESTKTFWQEKKKKVSEAIVSGNFPTPEELGISLSKLPQRLVEPQIKLPSAGMEKTFTWWDRRIHHRVLVTIENSTGRPAIGQEEFACPVEIKLNFTELLKESGVTLTVIEHPELDPQSVRVIEYSKDGTPIAEVPYQMDKTKFYAPPLSHTIYRLNDEYNLIWIIRKPIEPKAVKYFYIYFDVAKNKPPKYKVKYPYGELSVSGTDKKGYWLKNNRFKVEFSLPSTKPTSLINSWIVRNFSTGFFTNLNLIGKKGFGAVQGSDIASGLSLQRQANGPLLVRFQAVSTDGDGCVFNFYENLPICEVFTDSRINEFHNSYLIPQSYLATALKDKMSAFPGAEYLSSNYNSGKISPEHPLNLSFNDSYWLAQRIVKGLTIASITPEKAVTHYLKTAHEDSNTSISFGISGAKSIHHFIIYADTTEQDTFDLMNRIKNVFTLENIPVIQRTRAEKLLP